MVLQLGNSPRNIHSVSDPVSVSDGHLIGSDVDFIVPGPLELVVDRHYSSDSTVRTALGLRRFSSLDSFFTAHESEPGQLRYYDGVGRFVDFYRPVPTPGKFEQNSNYKNLKLYADTNRGLILEDSGISSYFSKHDDGIWRISRIEDRFGHRQLFKRNERGDLLAIDNSGGVGLAFSYDPRGLRRQVQLVGRDGSRTEIVTYNYDVHANLTQVQTPFGISVSMRYDEHNRLTSWSDSRGTEVSHQYDAEDRITHTQTNSAYNNDSFHYREGGGLTHFYPGGQKEAETQFFSDLNGNVYREVRPLGTGVEKDYDMDGYVTSETNGAGETIRYAYDINGNIASFTDGEGRETLTIYNEWNSPETVIDGGGNSWHYGYDERGALVSVAGPDGRILFEMANDDYGRLKGMMRSDGHLMQRAYNDYGDIAAISDFRGAVTKFTYDAFGRLTSAADAKGAVTKLVYEPQQGMSFWQPSAIIRPDNAHIQINTDHSGRIIRHKDAEGRETAYHYGAFGLLETIEDAKGSRLSFTYDGQERLETVTNQLGRQWTFERDAAGRVIKETDFAGLVQEYSYDKADRVIETRYADGAHLTFAYDKSGLLLEEQAFGADGGLQDKTTYVYNDAGLLKRAENNAAVVELHRDGYGRIIREKLNGRAIENILDCCGRRIGRIIDERITKTLYDPLGALKSLTIGDHKPLTMTLDPLGRELKRESGAGFMLNQTFDILGQLTGQKAGFNVTSLGEGIDALVEAQKRGLNPIETSSRVDRTYQWNKAFEPTNITDKRWGETAYTYDKNGQISEAKFGDGTAERFSYDPALNIHAFADNSAAKFVPWLGKQGGAVTEARGPNGEHIDLTYDSRNRVTKRTVTRNGFRIQTWHYTWDAKDRLVTAKTPSGDSYRYSYDPFGRRIFKIHTQAARAAQPADGAICMAEHAKRGAFHEEDTRRYNTLNDKIIVGTAYLWDGHTIAEEAPLLADGNPAWEHATRWHYEPDTFRPIAKETPSGELLYIITDHLGTPREMFTEDGNLAWAAQYRIWGGIKRTFQPENDNTARPYLPPSRGTTAFKYDTAEQAIAHECPIRFQGQWEDEETGLYYNRYRYYDPLTAQYFSPDPIGIAGGVRPQGYVHNPSVWIDPWGLAGSSCCAKFANKNRLADHYNRHGKDFGARTMVEYEAQASDFLTGSKLPGVLEKIRSATNDIIRYNPVTEEFGVLSKDGFIRTYYKPDPRFHGYSSNLDYFHAQ